MWLVSYLQSSFMILHKTEASVRGKVGQRVRARDVFGWQLLSSKFYL